MLKPGDKSWSLDSPDMFDYGKIFLKDIDLF